MNTTQPDATRSTRDAVICANCGNLYANLHALDTHACSAELLDALKLCVATLERVEPAHTHGGFSTIGGTLDVARAIMERIDG